MRLLLVEDQADLAANVADHLTGLGHSVQLCADGETAVAAARAGRFDMVVLDVMLPRLDGLAVCRALRQEGMGELPILMLTARDSVADRVAGLDAGADDYLVKPFAVDELLARVRALIRRREPMAPSAVLACADLRMDVDRRIVTRGTRSIELTKTEFDLLQLLLEQQDIVLSREYLYEHIWGFDFETNSKSLDVYVGYLRRKIEVQDEPRLLHTVRGVGYVIRTS